MFNVSTMSVFVKIVKNNNAESAAYGKHYGEVVISESVAHKSLVQTAERMKRLGYDTEEICKITGLGRDEIEAL